MKCLIVLVCFFCILSVALSYNIDKAYSEVMLHNQENMKNMKNMRSIITLDISNCYQEFVKNNNNLVYNFQENADTCVKTATDKKYSQLNETNSLKERTEIEDRVADIQKYFNDCSKQNGIDFYNCMAGNADWSINFLDEIKEKSRSVISSDFYQNSGIENEERTCLLDAVNNYKSKSDGVVYDMKSCLGTDIQGSTTEIWVPEGSGDY